MPACPSIKLCDVGHVPPLDESELLKDLNTRRIDIGQIDPQALPDGVTYWGRLKDSALDVYTYDAWYLDDSAVSQPYMPANYIFIGSPQARNVRHYGAIKDMNSNFAGRFFSKSWLNQDPSVRWVQVQSAPLPVTHQPDAFVSVKAL